jgi:hypothetical protein
MNSEYGCTTCCPSQVKQVFELDLKSAIVLDLKALKHALHVAKVGVEIKMRANDAS